MASIFENILSADLKQISAIQQHSFVSLCSHDCISYIFGNQKIGLSHSPIQDEEGCTETRYHYLEVLMTRPNDRRTFLKLWAASLPLILKERLLVAKVAGLTPKALLHTSVTVDRYVDKLPRLRTIRADTRHRTPDLIRMRMLECKVQLHSQLPLTKVWGYEGQYPGPVIEARRNRCLQIRWENRLPIEHIFPIDARIHGAMPPVPQVRTVPHLHGACTDSESDGLPENWFSGGRSALYTYPNKQRASTLWYHDHAIGITRLNVYAGLAGLYLLRDEEELSSQLPAGEFEIPLILQDRTVDEHGQLLYTPTMDDGKPLPPGVWGPMFFGELPVANGAIYPFLEVRPQLYRFRLLNGSNARFLKLNLNLAKQSTDIPQLIEITQIGSDGGFLPSPVRLTTLELAPGERADLLIDFSSYVGRTVTLGNDAPAPYPGWTVMTAMFPAIQEFMQFRVTLPSGPSREHSIPKNPTFQRLDRSKATCTRDFLLSEELDLAGKSLGLRMNGKRYSDPATEIVEEGTTEIWRFINTSDDAHPMHLHLVQFQILNRQGFDLGAYRSSGYIHPIGELRLPQQNEFGWKDTAVVNPGDILSIIACFSGYSGRYVFHCHMLEHEDNDMMRPFVVIPSSQL